jgi:hypothetical protein
MKKLLFIILFIFVSISLFSINYSEWKLTENDEFIFIFPEAVISRIAEIIEISDGIYDEYVNIYGYEPEKKIIVQISPYEDSANGFGLPTCRVYITLLPLNYPYRLDKNWLKTVLSHEIGHVFQLGYIEEELKWIKKYVSDYFAINALEPIWLIEGYAQLSSYLINGYDYYDHRRLSYLMDQIGSENPFDEEEIIAGKSSMGGEAYYNFGFAFILFLYEKYGIEKLIDLNEYKGSIKAFLGLDNALINIYNKNFEELKDEFLDSLKINGEGFYDNSYEFEGEITQSQKEFEGNVYYLKYSSKNLNYSLYKNDEWILSTPFRIEDFTFFEDELYLILIHTVNGLETTYLYRFSDDELKLIDFKHLLRIEGTPSGFFGIMNVNGTTVLVKVTPDFLDYDVLYEAHGESIYELSFQEDEDLLALRVNKDGEYFLYTVNTEDTYVRKIFIGRDFSIGSFDGPEILMSIYDDSYEHFGQFNLDEKCFYADKKFYKYGFDPADDETVLSEVNGLKTVDLTEESDLKLFFEEVENHYADNEVYEPAYRNLKLFEDWRYVGLYPYNNSLGVGFEDYLMNSTFVAGVFLKNDKLRVGLDLNLKEYFPFDVNFDLNTDFEKLYFETDFSKTFYLNPLNKINLDFSYLYPEEIRFEVENDIRKFGFEKENNVSDFSYKATFGYEEGETSLNFIYEYENYLWNEDFDFYTSVFGKYTSGNPYIFPVEYNNILIKDKMANGISLSLEKTFFNLDKSVRDFIYFGELRFGMRNSTLLGETDRVVSLKNSLDIFIKTTVFPYKTYPLQLSIGVTFSDKEISPYFGFYF